MTLAQVYRLLFASMLFVGPLSVTPWNKVFVVLLFVLSAGLLLLLALADNRLPIRRLPLLLISCYVGMFVIGFVSLMINASEPFGLLLSADSIGRLFTITTLSLTLLAGFVYLDKIAPDDITSLRWIWMAPLTALVVLGIYQVYCNFTGQAFLVDTRDWMHGVPASIRSVVPKRVTSVAEEPSFLAPLLVEAFLLAAFLISTTWLRRVALAAVGSLVLLTFSGGAYVNSAMVGMFAVGLVLWRFPVGRWHVLMAVVAFLGMAFLLTYGQVLIEFATHKFLHESGGGSSRSQFMSNLLALQFGAGLGSLLIGHGLTSMSHLAEFGMRTEDVLFRISNNMYLDVLWESGVLGLIAMLLLLGTLLFQGLNIQKRLNGRLSLSLLLTGHMCVTAMYRSEYISTHLVWMILLVYWAIKYEHRHLAQRGKAVA